MTNKKPLNIDIQSEIGQLDAVLLHTPGAEVENMTPTRERSTATSSTCP